MGRFAGDNVPMPTPPFTCRLKHGVVFSASPGKALTDALVGFFAGAMQHFKELRDVRKADVYTGGPYKATSPRAGVSSHSVSYLRLMTFRCRSGSRP